MARADGRILRSDETTLTLAEVREFYALLKQGENDIHDLEMLRDIRIKIRGVLGEYYDRAEALMMQARLHVRNGMPGQIADLDYALAIEKLDSEEGSDYCADIPLKMAEYNWILARLKDRKNYSGDDRMADRILRIHDAVTNAKEFERRGGNIAVKGEPEPISGNGTGEITELRQRVQGTLAPAMD
jgi:hypothetical protein